MCIMKAICTPYPLTCHDPTLKPFHSKAFPLSESPFWFNTLSTSCQYLCPVRITPSLLFFISLLLLKSWMTSIMIMIHLMLFLAPRSSPTLTSLCFWLCLLLTRFSRATFLIYKTQAMYWFPWMIRDCLGLELGDILPWLYSTSSTLPVPSNLLTSDYLSESPSSLFRHFRVHQQLASLIRRDLDIIWEWCFFFSMAFRSACFG